MIGKTGLLVLLCIVLTSCALPSSKLARLNAPDAKPEVIMETFLRSFVAYDYERCRSLMADGATITIIRQDGTQEFERSMQSATDWLNTIEQSGVKGLDTFQVEVHDIASQTHRHGATVTVKFTATGSAPGMAFANSGFDTGNLIETAEGWRIAHYSSFESFSEAE